MQAIDAAPPDVQTMRRTFTIERILSGDLAGLLKANQHQQQQQLPLARQPSGAVGANLEAAGGCDAGPSAAARLCGRMTSDRLQVRDRRQTPTDAPSSPFVRITNTHAWIF